MNKVQFWLKTIVNTYNGELPYPALQKLSPLPVVIQDPKYWENSNHLLGVNLYYTILKEEDSAIARAKFEWCKENLDENAYVPLHIGNNSHNIVLVPERYSLVVGYMFQDSKDATMFKLSFDEA